MKTILLLLAVLGPYPAISQAAPPVLHATSRTLDIRDGDRLLKSTWVVGPAISPDVYEPRRSIAEKRIVFISDVDSLSFDVEPGHMYDFLIVLNGADTCRTRISTMSQSYRRRGPVTAAGDTIPFTIRDGRIHVTASVNGSKPLQLMFDTGASIVCLRPSALPKGAKLELNDTAVNNAFGGLATQKLSRDNRVEVAGLTWDHESILYLAKQAGDSSDGILGYNVFEDKVVEIDYDRSVLVVRDSVPAGLTGYARLPMRFEGGLSSIETKFNSGQKPDSGWFVIDTGATAALQLRQDFAKEHGLYGTMKKIGTSVSRGVGRGMVNNEVVTLPELGFGAFVLRGVPIHLENPTAAQSVSSGCLLGMEALKRLNMIIDYPRNEVLLKPNAQFNAPFRRRPGGPPATVVFVLTGAALLVLAGFALFGPKRKGQSE